MYPSDFDRLRGELPAEDLAVIAAEIESARRSERRRLVKFIDELRGCLLAGAESAGIKGALLLLRAEMVEDDA